MIFGADFVEKGGHSELIFKKARGHLNLNLLNTELSTQAKIFSKLILNRLSGNVTNGQFGGSKVAGW